MMTMVNVEFMQQFIWLYAMSICRYILKHFGDRLPQHGLLFCWHLVKYLISSCYIITVVNLFIKSSSDRNSVAAVVITIESETDWFIFYNRWLKAYNTLIISPVVMSVSNICLSFQKITDTLWLLRKLPKLPHTVNELAVFIKIILFFLLKFL